MLLVKPKTKNKDNNNIVYGSKLDTGISTVRHTNTYAPGLATYGVTGIKGEPGKNGNSVFLTTYIFNDEDSSTICSRIASRKALVEYEDYEYDRPYQNGDMIIDKVGNMKIISDINQLIIDNRNKAVGSIDKYFISVGTYDIASHVNANIYNKNTVITENNDVKVTNPEALLTLVKTPENNISEFIDMKSIYQGIPDANFKVYFNNITNAFHLNSSYPICIDAPVSVKYNNTLQSTEYSAIQCTENSITSYVSICKDITVDIVCDVYSYTKDNTTTQYYGAIYTLTLQYKPKTTVSDTEDKSDDVLKQLISVCREKDNDINMFMLHVQNGMWQDYQKLREGVVSYSFKQELDAISRNQLIQSLESNRKNLQISLIYNLEVFLTKSYTQKITTK